MPLIFVILLFMLLVVSLIRKKSNMKYNLGFHCALRGRNLTDKYWYLVVANNNYLWHSCLIHSGYSMVTLPLVSVLWLRVKLTDGQAHLFIIIVIIC